MLLNTDPGTTLSSYVSASSVRNILSLRAESRIDGRGRGSSDGFFFRAFNAPPLTVFNKVKKANEF